MRDPDDVPVPEPGLPFVLAAPMPLPITPAPFMFPVVAPPCPIMPSRPPMPDCCMPAIDPLVPLAPPRWPLVSVMAFVGVVTPLDEGRVMPPRLLVPIARRIAEFIGGCDTRPLAPEPPALALLDALAPPDAPEAPADAPACNIRAITTAAITPAPLSSRSLPHCLLPSFSVKAPAHAPVPAAHTNVGNKPASRYSGAADRGAVRRSRWCLERGVNGNAVKGLGSNPRLSLQL